MQHNLILPVWKPIKLTSFDVVKKIRSIINQKKVGHAGTLDPFAEGVLVVCTGNKTSNIEKYMNCKKEYKGIISLGCRTSTLDPESPITEYKKIQNITKDKLLKIKNNFIGTIDQIPPQYSAIKHNGKPLYKYARNNIRINVKPRKVDIFDFQINQYNNKKIDFTILCGRGTYIRSIARDFAVKLGTLGYLTKLQRTKVGKFNFENSIKMENLEKCLYMKI